MHTSAVTFIVTRLQPRFSIMALLRQQSIDYAKKQDSDFYFVVDSDNFVAPMTLRSLVQVGSN